jgi:hypothetical protein
MASLLIGTVCSPRSHNQQRTDAVEIDRIRKDPVAHHGYCRRSYNGSYSPDNIPLAADVQYLDSRYDSFSCRIRVTARF